MTKYSKEEIETIYNDFIKSKLTVSDFSKSIDFPTIGYWLKKYDFIKEKHIGSRTNLNWKFESIKNETEAYIMGLIMSDGWVTSNRQIGIRLNIKDKNVLYKIASYFSENINLKKSGNFCLFKISSCEAFYNFKKYGITTNKTYDNLRIPEMNEELIRHFIRGYFDGDGTIYIDRNFLIYNICSINEEFLIQIQNVLSNNGIYSSINKEVRKGKKMFVVDHYCQDCKNMYRLFIRRKSELIKFHEFMYDKSTIFMERKYNKYRDNIELTKYKVFGNAEHRN